MCTDCEANMDYAWQVCKSAESLLSALCCVGGDMVGGHY